MPKVHYRVFKEFFKEFGINPYDFWILVEEDKLEGWFPNLPEREGKISLDRLIFVIEEGM